MVEGSGFRVYGLGLGVYTSRFLGSRVQSSLEQTPEPKRHSLNGKRPRHPELQRFNALPRRLCLKRTTRHGATCVN